MSMEVVIKLVALLLLVLGSVFVGYIVFWSEIRRKQ